MSEPTKSWSAGEQLNAADLNKNFTEALNNYRDFTYGATIVINEALYLKASDGKAYKTDADFLDERIENFIGFAKEDGNANDVKKVQVSGIVSGFAGLTIGSIYYLGNTAGAITSTPGTYSLPVGLAVSSTRLLLLPKSLLVSAQTFHGVKTFSSIPVLPASDPTTDNQASRKAYVDLKSGIQNVAFGIFSSSGGSNVDIAVGFTPKVLHIFGVRGVPENLASVGKEVQDESCVRTIGTLAESYNDRIIMSGSVTDGHWFRGDITAWGSTITITMAKTGSPSAMSFLWIALK